MEKLVMYVPKLLKALQIIDRDRNELYQLHLQVMHEGRAATKEISKRASLERELGKIYSELVDLNPDGIPSELSGMRIADENTVVMNRPRAFILYSFILWIFGALAVFVMRDYIRQSDVLLRFPADPIY